MSAAPIRYSIYPFVRWQDLESADLHTRMVRSNWAIEIIAEPELGEWNLDLSSAILSLPVAVRGVRLDTDAGPTDRISVSGHKPMDGLNYQIPVGQLGTICIDPVEKVFWVEQGTLH